MRRKLPTSWEATPSIHANIPLTGRRTCRREDKDRIHDHPAYTTEYDYEENTKRYADGKLKESPSSIYSQKSECDPEHGYLTRLQLDNTTYAGDQSVTNTFINTYDSYHRANGSVGINTINADTNAPVLIYNT